MITPHFLHCNTSCVSGTYECLCPDHLTGLHCEMVSAATLLGSTHLELPSPSTSDDIISIEFKFNTPLSSTLLYLTVVSCH